MRLGPERYPGFSNWFGKAVERSLDNPPFPMKLERMGHPVLYPASGDIRT
jgi:hypothetical protein